MPLAGALLFSLIILSGCEESGIVGSSFITNDPDVNATSSPIGPVTTEQLISYSGNKTFVAAGRFEDPIFGTYEATALVRPALISQASVVDIEAEYGLVLFRRHAYGDTSSASVNTYRLYEIERRWRQNEWRADSIAVKRPTDVTFEVSDSDSIFIPLPRDWSERYFDLYNNTDDRSDIYSQSLFGFAIVHETGNRIDYFHAQQSYLHIRNPDTFDDEGEVVETSFTSAINQRATTFSITEAPADPLPDNRIKVTNDFQSTGRVTIPINDELFPSRIITRVELVLQEDTQLLSQGMGAGFARFSNNQIRVYTLTEDEKEFFVTKEPIVTVQRSEGGRYRVNLTNFINNALQAGLDEVNLYFISDLDNGIIRPNVFVTGGESELAPRLIVTTINTN